ncbi:MAG: RNA polymerase sigma-70 factor (ECF subfamily) [Bradymonadia bacterium]|jgi:RNA polymerase sigma-70 factor (ECF subfamily)
MLQPATFLDPMAALTASNEPSDAALVASAVSGDRRAFRTLYDRHVRRVRGQVGRLIGLGPEVDDVTQDVFVQMHRSLAAFRGESAFSTWLYRLTWNVAISHRRKRKPTVDLESLRQLQLSTEDWKRLEARDLAKVLYAALDEVSDDGRDAFVLHHIEGHTLQEIAYLEGASINTIAARVRRTRAKLVDVVAKASANYKAQPEGGAQ